jgi:hypothetical protein
MTMGEDDNTQQQGAEVHSALTTLQPIRDLAKNWDIDIASWYVSYSTHSSVGPFGFHPNLARERMTVSAHFIVECDKNRLSDMILNAQ